MSDEMIQQQTPSKAKYVVPGAVLGTGAAAALGLCNKPGWAREAAKYASWDEAVAEMTKGDKFVSDIPEELKAEAQNLKNKAACKEALQKAMGLPVNPDVPLRTSSAYRNQARPWLSS